MKVGICDLPLHYGRCPRWLFERMRKLGKAVTEIIVYEYGKDEFLRRISDPFFFQSFACVLGFDWNSSGVTTTVTGALKEGLKSGELGIVALGGKGKASRRTLKEIENLDKIFSLSSEKLEKLKYASRMSAKVDTSAVQDGYNLYHHSFFVSEEGKWAVIQQGMNDKIGYARRYHWISKKVKAFVDEPQLAICCDARGKTLNMVAKESKESRKASVDLIKDHPKHLKKYLLLDRKHEIDLKRFTPLIKAYEFQPRNFEELLSIRGVGPKSIRALALLSNLIYGKGPSWKDPAKFSFCVGGKDGTPFPIDKKVYDRNIEILSDAVRNASLDNKEKLKALKRLQDFLPDNFK